MAKKAVTQDDKLFAFWDLKEQRKFASDFGKTLQEIRDASLAVGKDGKPGRSRKEIALHLLKNEGHTEPDINVLTDIDIEKPVGRLLITAIGSLMVFRPDRTPDEILQDLKDIINKGENPQPIPTDPQPS